MTLEREPRAEARAALEAAVVRLGPDMNAQDVANTVWAFSMLKGEAGSAVCAALEVGAYTRPLLRSI